MKPAIRQFVTDFLGEIVAGDAAVFAGAGLSVPAGYVDWRELVRPLAQELELDIDLESDLVGVAQFHVNANGANRHRLHQAVIQAIAPVNPPTMNHELLAQLPIRTWWTTNYDKLIEAALRNAGKVVDVKSAVPQLATSRPGRHATLYKMHGDVDRPDEAVATRDDYERYGNDRGAFITALAGDLVRKTFLFLGFSFSDPNLAHVLSRVRQTYTNNQRRHYAVFRRRTQLEGETPDHFAHHKLRQELAIEDLKRFNVKVLVVDDYDEITEFLRELVARFRRRTVFISASAADYSPWGTEAVSEFAETVGRRLIASGTRLATGIGLGIGDALLSGALREVISSESSIEENLVLRPFPRINDPAQQAETWGAYRGEIISHAGIAVFMFGTKQDGENIILADGMAREFEISREQGVAVIPIGASGGMAKELSNLCLAEPQTYLADLGADGAALIGRLAEPTEDLSSLVDPLLEVISKLQGGNAA